MKVTSVFCDRCHEPITDGNRSALTFECGPLRTSKGPAADLCRECGAASLRWIDEMRSTSTNLDVALTSA